MAGTWLVVSVCVMDLGCSAGGVVESWSLFSACGGPHDIMMLGK